MPLIERKLFEWSRNVRSRINAMSSGSNFRSFENSFRDIYSDTLVAALYKPDGVVAYSAACVQKERSRLWFDDGQNTVHQRVVGPGQQPVIAVDGFPFVV